MEVALSGERELCRAVLGHRPPPRRPRLCHTYATDQLNAGAKLVDIQALLGHSTIATTQINTNVGQERMEQVVGRL